METGIEQLGTWIAFVLTLMIYCYLGKEIPLLQNIYRFAIYIFIGISLGYGAVMAWHGVLRPRWSSFLQSGEWWYLLPFVLCLLLLTKISPATSKVGNVTVAFLFGIGMALVIGGGLTGTVLPQIESTINPLRPDSFTRAAQEGDYSPIIYVLNALLVVIGTISTLLYFQFTEIKGTSRFARVYGYVTRLSAGFGKVFMMFTFGAIFATTIISRISLLVGRVRFLLETALSVFSAK